MGRLTTGVSIILFVLFVGVLVAFVKTDIVNFDSEEDAFTTNCTEGNATSCSEEAQSSSDFFGQLFDATIEPFDDVPAIFNALWLLVMVALLSMAVLLIIDSQVPLLSE